ncbi:MAG: hypothetical protein FD172_3908 [Methylocystaceae bacterium]|nr:MAG: hypothetical protein FD172_3908 [Methylocystaceae bacterium]
MQTLNKGKATPAEREKLIEEMQNLIKEKHLDVSLHIDKPLGPKTLLGCDQCTICPCMICH